MVQTIPVGGVGEVVQQSATLLIFEVVMASTVSEEFPRELQDMFPQGSRTVLRVLDTGTRYIDFELHLVGFWSSALAAVDAGSRPPDVEWLLGLFGAGCSGGARS